MMKLSLTTVTDLLKKRMTDFRLAGYAPEIGGGGPHHKPPKPIRIAMRPSGPLSSRGELGYSTLAEPPRSA